MSKVWNFRDNKRNLAILPGTRNLVTSSAISSMRLWDSSIKSRAHVSRSRLRALRHSCYESASLNAMNVETVRAFAQIPRSSVYLRAKKYEFCRRKICAWFIYHDDRDFRAHLNPFFEIDCLAKLTELFEVLQLLASFWQRRAEVQARKSRELRPYSCHVLGIRPKPSRTILNQGIRIILNVGHPFSAVLAHKDARLRSTSTFLRIKVLRSSNDFH